MARSKTIEPPPSQELLEAAARRLAKIASALPADTWARLVRCQAMATAKAQRARLQLAGAQGPGRPADLPKPGPRRPTLPPAPRQRNLFDARKAAANDLDDDDDEA